MKATDKQIAYLYVLSERLGDDTDWDGLRKNGLTTRQASEKITEMRNASFASGSCSGHKRVTKIKITGFHADIPAEIYFGQFLLLRIARKVGDVECVNNYQLGKLNDAQAHGCIEFVKL